VAAAQPAGVTPLELVTSLLADRDETFAVTGATGWFGATAMDLLYGALGGRAPAQVVGYASTARRLTLSDGRSVPVRPLSQLSADPPPSVLLHFAFATKDRAAELGLADYVLRNVAITTAVLGAVRRHRPGHVVVASSGAVYAPGRELVDDVAGEPYGALKRLDELAFRAAADEVGATLVVPRVFSVAGPRMTKPEKYALGDMLAAAREGRPVVVRADRPVYRSYCGVDEVVALCLWAALGGRGMTFDTGGEVVEMADLARTAAESTGTGSTVVRDRFDPSAAVDRYVGDARDWNAAVASAGLRTRPLADLVAATSW